MRLEGELIIIKRTGSRGDFNVGKLKAKEGVFQIKDALIDEYEAGTYKGTFEISHIRPNGYVWDNKFTVEILASVEAIWLTKASEGVAEESPATPEPDPMLQSKLDVPVTPLDSPSAETVTSTEAPIGESAKLDQESAKLLPQETSNEIFDAETRALIFKRKPIKLDPSIGADVAGRTLFRNQRDSLKKLGYSFDATAQSWFFQGIEEAELVS